ncbi:MAG: glycoside hydrolase family 26 protein [Alicyclobacillus sp.]|nr:glycoside hydrolase family 26 protein [Alicyclobacillus sp.]
MPNLSSLSLRTLSDPSASPETKRLISFLVDTYGNAILSGQQEAPSDNPPEFDFMERELGRLPAIRCLDYLHYSPSVDRPDGVTERAIEWDAKGGIVSICFHWFAPSGGASFYTKDTQFDVTKAVTPGTEEHALILRDLDRIAEELTILRDKGIPVLWRPLHEADGAWFWWGAKGAEPCKELLWIMHDRFTNHHKLNNLIWVWTFARNEVAADWYPGDDYIDIVGIDKYFEAGDYTANAEGFQNLSAFIQGRKLITMPENGPIPDPDALIAEQAAWLWFCPWWGHFLMDGKTNDADHLCKVYNHPYVITLDKLPDLKTYPIK